MGGGELETADRLLTSKVWKVLMLKGFPLLCSTLAAWSIGVVELVLEETDFDIWVAPG